MYFICIHFVFWMLNQKKETSMESIDFMIKFLKYFILINIGMMILTFLITCYVDSGYRYFKKLYSGSEDEYKTMLVGVIHIWRLLLIFFGLIPLLTLLVIK